MNRRGFLSLLGIAPIATAAVVKDVGAAPMPAVTPLKSPGGLSFPVGYIRDAYVTLAEPSHTHSITLVDPGHTHSWGGLRSTGIAVARREIFDGEKFVPFESAEGTMVLNKVLTGGDRGRPAKN